MIARICLLVPLLAIVSSWSLAGQAAETVAPEIQRLLDKAQAFREDRAFNKAYRALGKAYDRGGDDCLPCVLAFVDTDLASGDLDGALDSAGVAWPGEDEISLLRHLANRTKGDSWQVVTRLVWRLAEARDLDQLLEVVEAYLDSHQHRVRSSVCAATFASDPAFAAELNEELDGLGWRGPFMPGGAVTPARGLDQTIPKPTARSLINGTAGDVHLFAVVSKRGRASSVRTMSGLADGLSGQAESAVWDWRFVAGTRNGEPVDTCVSIALRFPLRR